MFQEVIRAGKVPGAEAGHSHAGGYGAAGSVRDRHSKGRGFRRWQGLDAVLAGGRAFWQEGKGVSGRMLLQGVRRCVAPLAFALVCASLCFGGNAQAAARSAAVTVKIPVTCQAAGLEEVTFTARLRLNEDGAVPVEVQLKHKETKEFVLDFDKPGEYYFTIQQQAGEDARIVYDKSCYWLHASVTSAEDGLAVSTVLWKDGSSAKRTQVKFVNRMQGSNGEDPDGEEDPDGSTGDDSNSGGNGSGGNGSNDGSSNGSGGSNDGSGNGNDSNGNGSTGSGSGNGSGTGSGGSGNGSGNGSNSGTSDGSSSFWGNGGFWGSSSSGGSLVSAIVRTGDAARVILWIGLLMAALAAAAGAWLYQRNKEEEANRKDREDG